MQLPGLPFIPMWEKTLTIADGEWMPALQETLRKPPVGSVINWSHPLNRGCVFACIPQLNAVVDLVSGLQAKPDSAAYEAAFGPEGEAIKSSETTGARWVFPALTGLDKIAGPCSAFAIARNYVNTTVKEIFNSGESGLGNGWGFLLDDQAVVTNGLIYFADNSNRCTSSAEFLSADSELRYHRVGVSADGTNAVFYTSGKTPVTAATTFLPTANANRRVRISGRWDATRTGFGLVALFGWDRVLSPAEFQELLSHPYGTPDNPRFLSPSPRQWFTLRNTPAAGRVWCPGFNFIKEKPPLTARVNWSHPLNRGLGLWLPLSEGSGTAIHNLAGPEILTAPPAVNYWSVGKHGPQIGGSFDQANQYYFTSPLHRLRTPIATDGAYTVSSWMINNGVTGFNSLFDIVDGLTSGYVQAVVGLDGSAKFFGYITEDHTLVCTGPACPSGRWLLATWVVRSSPSDGYLDVYVDGKLWDSITMGSTTDFATDRAWSYGVGVPRDYGAFEWNQCRSADLQFWNRALSATEVWQLYQSYFNSPLDNPRLIVTPGLGYFPSGGEAPSVTPLTASVSDWMSLYWSIVQQG